MVRRGQEMFCGCSRFRFGARVIYGTAVFIESVFLTSFSLSYVLQVTAVTLNYVDEVFCVTGQVRFYGSVSPV